MRILKRFLIFFLAVYLAPLGLHAAIFLSQERPTDWRSANWSSAALLPPPATSEPAAVYVFAGRVARSRGVFAHHHWMVVKERGATAYTRYDVTSWAGVRENGWAPDGRWFGDTPILVGKIEGEAAERAIPKVRAAVLRWRDDFERYVLWPGPNSNSFIAMLVAAIPDSGISLLPTGIGKDYRGTGFYAGATPSHSGVQASAYGVLGFSLGWVEGVELNLLGLVAGLDVRRPALKLPGFGRIGAAPVAD
ncbi:DUF3750 domain-containing protein [Terrarubrum flagellatum]|uniref:DUF3750 domain-containing protein n=1 Tax=Terrirubrum flagellatum TaxID=2895980 RepID=UPI0031454073